jgi:hypothetical protein
MDGSDVANVVVLVDHDCHMVGETRGQERKEKNRKHGNPVKSHRQIQHSGRRDLKMIRRG